MPIGVTFRGMMGSSGVAAAATYSYALFTWGHGTNGALGHNNTTNLSVPMQVGVQVDWASVDLAGSNVALATKLNGTLWAWGSNTSTSAGNLGLGNAVATSSPSQVGTLSDWSQIASGGANTGSFAVKTDGTLWSWGTQPYGALGQGDTTARSSPVQVGSLTTWSQVSANWRNAMAVKTDGTLWSLGGQNTDGELGHGDTTNRSSPVQVGSLTDWSRVSVGYNFVASVKTDGTMWTWGKNLSGALGLGDTTSRSSPVKVGSLTDWSTVMAGTWFVIAQKTDGTLWSWGQGSGGTHGLGDTANRSSPVQIGSLTTWGSVNFTAGNTGIAVPHVIKNDKTLWGWGNEYKGTLGDNAEVDRSSPTQIGGATDWFATEGSDNAAVGIRKINNNAGYALWTWGRNNYGQLGQNNTTNTSSPIQLGTLNDWSHIAVGSPPNVAAIKTDGTLWTWGNNTYGQLGQNDTVHRSSPAQIGNLSDWSSADGGNHFLLIKTDGTLWAMGRNNTAGGLGDGTAVSRSSPVQIGSLTTWSKVRCIGRASMALKTNGTLWTWGEGSNGLGGHGDTVVRSSPVQVGSLTDWASIGGGIDALHAVKTDGTLWCWGQNSKGQIGDGTVVKRSSPVQVGSLTDWATVAGGNRTALAVKTDGSLWVWGGHNQGATGLGNVTYYSSPVQVGSLTDWGTMPSTMDTSSQNVKTDGTLWMWGAGTSGILGNRKTIHYSSPIQIGSGAGWNSAVGLNFTVGLRRPTIAAGTTNGYLFAWGRGTHGRGGWGDAVTKSSPIQVGTDNNWTHLHGSGNETVGVKSNGTLWAWGQNAKGGLGLGNTTAYSSPVQVGELTTWSKAYNSGAVTTAITTSGTIWSWGQNHKGQLGQEDTTYRSSPVQIGSLTTWAQVHCMGSGVLGIKTNGTFWTWGYNGNGNLAQGDTTDRSSPTQVGSLTTWSVLGGGQNEFHIIKTDGTLFGCGFNNQGQLGDESTTQRTSLVGIGSLTTWSDVASVGATTFALKTDGTLWAWGKNSSGECGQNDTTARSSPVQIGTLTDWSIIPKGGGNVSSIGCIKTDGTFWGWGDGYEGYLGRNNQTDYSSPVQLGHHNDWAFVAVGGQSTRTIRKAYK